MFAEHWPTSAAVYLPHGPVPAAGARFRNPALADTFERLLAEAPAGSTREAQIEAARRAFYEGFVAEAVDAFQSGAAVMDSSGRRHTGLLRAVRPRGLARHRGADRVASGSPAGPCTRPARGGRGRCSCSS